MNLKYLNPVNLVWPLGSRGYLNWMPDAMYLKLCYRSAFHRKLDLSNPKTYNEKLQWMKLYDRNPLYRTLVDKYAVREYVAKHVGEEYLIPQVGGPWSSPDEIDFDALPEQFVLKCRCGSSYREGKSGGGESKAEKVAGHELVLVWPGMALQGYEALYLRRKIYGRRRSGGTAGL